jgi:hypothetical protein
MAVTRKYKCVWVCQDCSAEIGTATTTRCIGGTGCEWTVSEDNACETHQTSNPAHLNYKKEEYIVLEVT